MHLLCLAPPSSSSPLPNVQCKKLDLELSSLQRYKVKLLLITKCPSCGIGRPRTTATCCAHSQAVTSAWRTDSGWREGKSREAGIYFTPLFLDLPAFWAKVIPFAIGMVTDGSGRAG